LTETKAKKYWAGFCSKKCADDAKRTGLSVKKICVYCGDEYKLKPCAKKSRYCSQECHGLDKRKPWANADNRERHKKEYLKWRMKVLVRDNFTCNDCKKEGDIAHHLELFGKYPEKRFDIENGITLCKRCHLKRHMKELHQ